MSGHHPPVTDWKTDFDQAIGDVPEQYHQAVELTQVGMLYAGDVGATFTLDREFPSGWKLGAFATLTNVSAKEFGEGSFDKGIRLTVPLAWITGQPSRRSFGTTIRPLTRDGGCPEIAEVLSNLRYRQRPLRRVRVPQFGFDELL